MSRDDYIPELMDIQRLSLIKYGVPWHFVPTAYLESVSKIPFALALWLLPSCPPRTPYDNLGPGDG
jgi:hypothetical protein